MGLAVLVSIVGPLEWGRCARSEGDVQALATPSRDTRAASLLCPPAPGLCRAQGMDLRCSLILWSQEDKANGQAAALTCPSLLFLIMSSQSK